MILNRPQWNHSSKALESHPGIKKLSLAHFSRKELFYDSSAHYTAISSIIAKNSVIEELDISNNQMEYEDLSNIIEALKSNSSLKFLNISRKCKGKF
jgi:hypothetical protein